MRTQTFSHFFHSLLSIHHTLTLTPLTMPLSQESTAAVLSYLDPYLDTLETGFPTSTRPNEPLLTKELKRAKIEATLLNDPAIFLAKWGSVILYPRPQAKSDTDSEEPNGVSSGASHKVDSLASAKNILDLFSPLAGM